MQYTLQYATFPYHSSNGYLPKHNKLSNCTGMREKLNTSWQKGSETSLLNLVLSDSLGSFWVLTTFTSGFFYKTHNLGVTTRSQFNMRSNKTSATCITTCTTINTLNKIEKEKTKRKNKALSWLGMYLLHKAGQAQQLASFWRVYPV